MEKGKRRAFIKQRATARKRQEGGLPNKGTSSVNPSTKRKLSEKIDCPPKKPKVMKVATVSATTDPKKSPLVRKDKGLMTGQVPVAEKHPILFHEDSQYALEQLLSIIKDDDYEALSNHAAEAMGETGLFSIAQVHPFPSFFR